MLSEKIKISRIKIYRVFILLVTIVLILRLVDLQLVRGNDFYQMLTERKVKSIEVEGQRGYILDRRGEIIAYNEAVYDVLLYYRRQTEEERNNSLLLLYEILLEDDVRVISDFDNYIRLKEVDGETEITFSNKLIEDEEAKRKWISEMVLKEKDADLIKSADDVFKYFRDRKFEIDETITTVDAYHIMEIRYNMLIKGYSSLTYVKIAENVSKQTLAKLEERKNIIKGLETKEKYIRKYLDSEIFAPVTGYIRAIDPDEFSMYSSLGYAMDQLIGKEGLEKSYEAYLKAKDGTQTAVVPKGTSELSFETSLLPMHGYDIVTTIDYKVQKTAYNALKSKIEEIVSDKNGIDNFGDAKTASAVMLDVRNGAILSLVSYPSYDANKLIENDEEYIEKLTNDPNKPLLNRAIQGLYPPGSVFKPLTAISALEEGVIEPGELIDDEGVINIDGMDFYSMSYKKYGTAYGLIDLKTALEVSANVFFYKIGMEAGIQSIDYWAKQFGLGEPTGIDIQGEQLGQRNNYDAMKKYEPDRRWGRADTAQASIGQLYNQYTPLQLVRYIGAIANGGILTETKLVDSIRDRDGALIADIERDIYEIPLKNDTIDEVNKGMQAVANEIDGTAYKVFENFEFGEVAAKTGTAETGLEGQGVSSHSIFVCYAPIDDPEIAVCVVIENGVWGANGASVARDMMVEYFENEKE